jgi:hypothetical protein
LVPTEKERTRQLSVTLENVPGQLGRLCRVLAQADVNVRGMAINEGSDVSTIRLVVSDTAAAERALREAGLMYVVRDVVLLKVDDRPGALEAVAVRLGDSGINIQYMYGTGDSGQGKAILVLRPDDAEGALQSID